MSNIWHKSRGIMLITVLFLTVFLVMFAAIALGLALTQQHNASTYYQRVAALKAAETGINYAMMRLSQDPGWRGCEHSMGSGSEHSLVKDEPSVKLDVYEHPVNGSANGCVEGRASVGGYTGYFDMYFARPADSSAMKFFTGTDTTFDGKPGPGSMPGKILLCANNCSDSPIDTTYSTGEQGGKEVPPTAVLIACRGIAGSAERTIESCFMIGPPTGYDSVSVSRGDTRIRLSGEHEGLVTFPRTSLVLFLGMANTPSIMRAGGKIDVELLGIVSPADGGPSSYDYLTVQGASHGKASVATDLRPEPASFGTSFTQEDNQAEHLRQLKKSEFAPSLPTITRELKGGTYFITAMTPGDREKYPTLANEGQDFFKKYPKVLYFPSTGAIAPTNPHNDLTETFASMIGGNAGSDAINWNYMLRRISFNESFKTGSAGPEGLVFRTSDSDCLTVRIGAPTEQGESVFLVNSRNGGGIKVEGILDGSGTVMCDGDLEMQSQSQLSTNNARAGINIYSGGTVTVHQLKNEPYIDAPGAEAYNSQIRLTSKLKDNTCTDFDSPDSSVSYYDQDSFDEEEWQAVSQWSQTLQPGTYNIYNEENQQVGNFTVAPGSNIVVVTNGSPTTQTYLAGETPTGGDGETHEISDGDVRIILDKGAPPEIDHGGLLPPSIFDDAEEVIEDPGADGGNINVSGGHPGGSDGSGGGHHENIVMRPFSAKDSVFRGLVYACKDFIVNSKDYGFMLDGGLVAYGKDPENNMDNGSQGKIDIAAKNCRLKYNSRFLSLLRKSGSNQVVTLYWSIY